MRVEYQLNFFFFVLCPEKNTRCNAPFASVHTQLHASIDGRSDVVRMPLDRRRHLQQLLRALDREFVTGQRKT